MQRRRFIAYPNEGFRLQLALHEVGHLSIVRGRLCKAFFVGAGVVLM